MVKKRSSKLAQSVMRAMRKNGLAKKTGPSTLDVIRAADEGDELGAKHKPPRPYVKSRPDGAEVVYVRDGKNRESLNVAIRKGMTKKQILLAVDIELEKYNERRDDEYLEEKPPGHERTNKRAEPADLIGPLRDLVPRWEFKDKLLLTANVIHDAAGKRINDLRKRFDAVADAAGLPWVTPHHCKHTGATLYTYAGVDRYDLADAFSTEADTLKKNYVHLQVRWRDRTKKNVDPKTVTLLSLRHLLPKSNEEWLKGAARLKEDYERRERAKLQKAAGSAASRDGEGVAA
jgi:hypothetical protein